VESFQSDKHIGLHLTTVGVFD